MSGVGSFWERQAICWNTGGHMLHPYAVFPCKANKVSLFLNEECIFKFINDNKKI